MGPWLPWLRCRTTHWSAAAAEAECLKGTVQDELCHLTDSRNFRRRARGAVMVVSSLGRLVVPK